MSLIIRDVPGHVDAHGRLTIDNASSAAIQHIEVGQEFDVNPDHLAPTTIGGGDLKLGFQGRPATISDGNLFPEVVRTVLLTSPVVVCSTGKQPHKGRWRVRARVQKSSTLTDVYMRLSWRVGDGPFVSEPWVVVPDGDYWFDPCLAILNIPEVASGEHSWEGRIEAYASNADFPQSLDLDYLSPFPAGTYSCMRAPFNSSTAETLSAYDLFDQTSGALTGDSSTSGHSWTSAGGVTDADDFTQSGAPTKTVIRTATSDTGTNIRYGRGVVLGSAQSNVEVSVRYLADGVGTSAGVIARFVDNSNFIAAVIPLADFAVGITVFKVVAGTVTSLGSIDGGFFSASAWMKISLTVLSNGKWEATYNDATTISGVDSDLGPGGALASGKPGMIDWSPSGIAATRYYAGFLVNEPALDYVCFPGRSLTLDHKSATRESADGEVHGAVPAFEGGYLKIPPGGIGRLAIAVRQFDVDSGLPDVRLTDGLTSSLSVTPRVTAFSKQLT